MDRFTVLLSSHQNQSSENHIELPTFVTEIYEESVLIKKSYNEFELKICYFRNKHNPLPRMVFEDREYWYLISGYIIENVTNENIAHYFKVDSDCRPVRTSLGGQYSYVTIRKADGQVSAGQSFPGWEPMFYAQGSRRLVLSNNPLQAHLSAINASRPITRDGYFLDALQGGGVAINDTTPYEGCRRLSKGTQLVVCSDENFTIRDIDPPKYGNHSTLGINNRINAFVDSMNYVSTIFKKLPAPQFQISGGRDSRLVAAMFKANDIDVIPENKSLAWTSCGQISDRIAQILGHDECGRDFLSVFPPDQSFESLTQEKIRYQSGLPLIASPQYSSRLGGHKPGHPMVYGHSHSQRGGLRVIRHRLKAQSIINERMLNPCLSDTARAESEQLLKTYINEKSSQLKYIQSLSLHSYFDFPLNYHYSPYQSYFANWHTPVMPLADERFSLYCLDLSSVGPKGWHWPFKRRNYTGSEMAGMSDLHSDRLAMEATFRLAPELLDLPLDNNRYAIERRKPFRHSVTSSTHKLRNPLNLPNLSAPKGYKARKYYPGDTHAANTIWRYLDETGLQDTFREFTKPEVVDFVSSPESGMPQNIPSTHVRAHMWTAYGLAMALKTAWYK